MRNTARSILGIIAGGTVLFACILIFIVCAKTVLFSSYDPTDGCTTFIYMNVIAGAVYLIRWLIKPEFTGYSDKYETCEKCGAWNDPEEDEDCVVCNVPVTEEQFNEAVNFTSPCGNNSCDEIHTVGSDVRYDKNYNTYCDNNECAEGVATIGSTTLEQCWFDPNA
ncbi:MAG: hypothetical protein KUG81_02440 [Gammaproteobacteria bacterium]|nr:hypothetical protein [Gammaproteobacteria bacterium]